MAYTTSILDTSHWRPKLIREKLVGLTALIGRMGTQWVNLPPEQWLDHTFTDHCQVAYDLDIPFGGFWYDDWTWFLDNGWTWGRINEITPQTDPRITAIRRALFAGSAMRKVHFLGIDIEQQTRGGQTVKEPNWVAKSSQTLFENLLWMMNHNEIPVMPILIYSRKSFMDEFAVTADGSRPVDVWMSNYYRSLGPKRIGNWIADWRFNRAKSQVYAVPDLVNALPAETPKPAVFGEVPVWLWQCIGDKGNMAFLEGVQDDRNIPLASDISTLMIPKETFHSLVDFTPRTGQPEPPPDDGGTTPPPSDQPALMMEIKAVRSELGVLSTHLGVK